MTARLSRLSLEAGLIVLAAAVAGFAGLAPGAVVAAVAGAWAVASAAEAIAFARERNLAAARQARERVRAREAAGEPGGRTGYYL